MSTIGGKGGPDERSAFEEWIRDFLPHVAGFYFDQNTDGNYTSVAAQARWEAWQARAAISRAEGEV